ncbi:P1 family peptidase [Methylobacterium radiotolerans]|jgi:L-aminopeptidase/D-esterase-like protein|uniref:P1 family peptidase n=1 Tax=Methylobacterium TaxID=407 RepID=UPI0004643C8F|nr:MULTISPECIES: P1 family peptidase [Methylobacterium]GAN48582.1 peptidase S58 DmpA [Methylobacterium sp. ME121]KTS06837.1 peptidase T4 [Methylobacterium radiotolerans]KTS46400.1 peptidase T4 [Methylobacterium radiotolerans]KZC02902.1 putative aminopeptidase [Methylobacterium radiotolerans]MBN6822445.1 P1 family peptidase [Methylobacterium organophilum]
MPQNRITDIPGLRVGHATDLRLASGVTAILFDQPAVAAVDVRGGGPGTRETDLLDPERTVERVDAFVLSGGSAFGLDAGAGVAAWLAEAGRGFPVGAMRVPIVPGAVLFDLPNGGDKAWGRYPPYRELGFQAAAAATEAFALGSVGAGTGARTGRLKGGIGSASAAVPGTGFRVGALAAVNAFGNATIGGGPHFWAAPFEVDDEFGGLGVPVRVPPEAHAFPARALPGAATTLAVVATDAALTKAQCRRLAVAAQDGLARALVPAHTPLDGDLVFAAATGAVPLGDTVVDLARLGDAAARVLARAVARGVFSATSLPGHAPSSPLAGTGLPPAWRDVFGA